MTAEGRRRAALLVRVGLAGGAVLLLEGACRAGLVDPLAVIPPSEMAASMVEQLGTAETQENVVQTFSTIGAAVLLAVGIGTALGAAVHAAARLRRALDPLLASYYSVPTFVFYPLLVALLGLNKAPLVVLGLLSGVPAVLLKVARVQRLGRVRTLLAIVLPAALPRLFSGFKLALSYALIGVIAGEFILSGSGLGYAISFAYQSFDNRTMYGLMLFVLLVAVTANGILYTWEGRLLRRRSRA